MRPAPRPATYVLGFCIVTLGLFTANGFYPIDFAYRFGKKRHPKSPEENIGDPRSISGQKSFEAKHYTKLELALMMIQSAINCGILPGYVHLIAGMLGLYLSIGFETSISVETINYDQHIYGK
ncbi:hypothetical protein K8R14_01670 [bacterium]|nr:hypothetical protein [bacterium]